MAYIHTSRPTLPGRRGILAALVAACAALLVPNAPAPLTATGSLGAPAQLAAQSPAEWDSAREQMTRAELEELLTRLEANSESSAYSSRMRAEMRQSIEAIRRRLEHGDFQVGDRIVLWVEREPELSDTLVVSSGGVVHVPIVGDMSVQGVLRSELQSKMQEHIGTYIRNPTVRAQALIRILVHGEVSQPGFYTVPAETVVSDALMIAGGPTQAAKLTDLRVERGSTNVWEGESMQVAVAQGRTLDQMNIQAGDRIVIPTESRRDGWEVFRIVAYSVSAAVSLGFAISRIF